MFKYVALILAGWTGLTLYLTGYVVTLPSYVTLLRVLSH